MVVDMLLDPSKECSGDERILRLLKNFRLPTRMRHFSNYDWQVATLELKLHRFGQYTVVIERLRNLCSTFN